MVEGSNIHPGCGKPWDLHTEGTVGDTQLPALHCPGATEVRRRERSDIVKQVVVTTCSCGEKLTGFTVDIGDVYETEPFDPVDLLAIDAHEAVAFCEGYSTVHDVISFAYLFSGNEKPKENRHEGIHQEVPKVETSPLPRHPFFFRKKA